ncbi:unnamed protein product [Calypogeia fissa]
MGSVLAAAGAGGTGRRRWSVADPRPRATKRHRSEVKGREGKGKATEGRNGRKKSMPGDGERATRTVYGRTEWFTEKLREASKWSDENGTRTRNNNHPTRLFRRRSTSVLEESASKAGHGFGEMAIANGAEFVGVRFGLARKKMNAPDGDLDDNHSLLEERFSLVELKIGRENMT